MSNACSCLWLEGVSVCCLKLYSGLPLYRAARWWWNMLWLLQLSKFEVMVHWAPSECLPMRTLCLDFCPLTVGIPLLSQTPPSSALSAVSLSLCISQMSSFIFWLPSLNEATLDIVSSCSLAPWSKTLADIGLLFFFCWKCFRHKVTDCFTNSSSSVDSPVMLSKIQSG